MQQHRQLCHAEYPELGHSCLARERVHHIANLRQFASNLAHLATNAAKQAAHFFDIAAQGFEHSLGLRSRIHELVGEFGRNAFGMAKVQCLLLEGRKLGLLFRELRQHVRMTFLHRTDESAARHSLGHLHRPRVHLVHLVHGRDELVECARPLGADS